ncbi:MAG: NAD-dependent epimerase/dehydratase family protein [Candidatus Eisenbacteria bacterium]|nr:NAD-dependent epimerase/dehydratase family protein [Candidatus Eisenbacteria bacterium]
MNERIFVTGATGYIGGAVAARLARQGHTVYGLTRNRESAKALATAGVTPVHGDLARPGDWRGVLQNCDAAVHCAFDAQNGAADVDLCALDALRSAALDGRVRRVLYTSGIWVHGSGVNGQADEATPLAPLSIVQWRAAHEEIALDLADHEVAVVILRPGMVYGEQRGILGGWFAEAHEHHTVTYPGDGSQHWSMVHRDDVADAYALALEHAEPGSRYLLADESQHTVKELAESVATATVSRAVSWPAEDLIKSHGGYGEALLNDLRVSCAKARRELGWVPRHTSFAAEAADLWRDWQAARIANVR